MGKNLEVTDKEDWILDLISTVHQVKELDNVVSKVGKVAKLISHSLKSPKSLNYLSILLI